MIVLSKVILVVVPNILRDWFVTEKLPKEVGNTSGND